MDVISNLNIDIDRVRQDWKEKIYNNPQAIGYLQDESWSGVLIGFLIGYGFSLESAIHLSKEFEC